MSELWTTRKAGNNSGSDEPATSATRLYCNGDHRITVWSDDSLATRLLEILNAMEVMTIPQPLEKL